LAPLGGWFISLALLLAFVSFPDFIH
jgi:hypothetical protein